MGDIESADRTTTGPSKIIGPDIVRASIAQSSRTYDKAVGIVLLSVRILCAGIVPIMVEAELSGISLPDKVLLEQVRDDDLPVPSLERVQHAIGIFFQQVEVCEVPLIAIIVETAEESNARLVVLENEA